MKKLLLALLLTVPLLSKSQITIPIGIGIDFQTLHVPFNMELSYEKWNSVIGAEMRIDLCFDSNRHDYLGFKAGYDFHISEPVSIISQIGYYVDVVTQFKGVHNQNSFGASIKAVYWGKGKLNYSLDAAYILSPQLTFGVVIKP